MPRPGRRRFWQSIPKDPEAAYTVGVIDWTQAHENMLKALVPAGINDDGEGNTKAPKKVMDTVKEENAPLVDEGAAVSQSGGSESRQL